jgi:hypothetical protein
VLSRIDDRRDANLDASEAEPARLVARSDALTVVRMPWTSILARRRQNSALALRQLPTAAASNLAAFGPSPSPSGSGSSSSRGGTPGWAKSTRKP